MDETKTCPVCGEAFHIGNLHPINFESKIYCSASCVGKAARKRQHARRAVVIKSFSNCKKCGTTIPRTGARGRVKEFCSACYQQQEYERKTKFALQNKEKLNELAKARYRQKRDEYLAANKESIEKRKALQKQKSREVKLKWIAANPEKIRMYKERGAEKRRLRARRQHANYSSTLADPYIKHLLTQGTAISKKAVPQSLIDLKRVQVQITRKLKELQDAEPDDRD